MTAPRPDIRALLDQVEVEYLRIIDERDMAHLTIAELSRRYGADNGKAKPGIDWSRVDIRRGFGLPLSSPISSQCSRILDFCKQLGRSKS